MKKIFTKGRLAIFIVLAVLIIDQIIKIWVNTSMYWHESIRITDWFYIYFTENNGMAFGMEIFDKLFLTSFRVLAAIGIGWLLAKYVKQNYKTGFIVCVALILAGAVGNIIDCVFYGQIFNESTHSALATFVPFGEGYADWFHGKVVDMFYFPLFEFDWPQWIPFIGGNHFIFFSPIFNFADAAISCGIIAMILFYSKYLNELVEGSSKKVKKNNEK